MMHAGIEECIGTWRFHSDIDIAIWRAVQVAKFFNDALLVWEANSLSRVENEGAHSMTITDSIKNVYHNLYFRDDPQKIKEGLPLRYGFFTSQASKTDLITSMTARLRDMGYIERDKDALDEAGYYELKDDGTWGAIRGKNDDIHMSRMIALKVSSTMPLPAQINHTPRPAADLKTAVVRNEAFF